MSLLSRAARRLGKSILKVAAQSPEKELRAPAKVLLELVGANPAEFGMGDRRRERLEVASRVLAGANAAYAHPHAHGTMPAEHFLGEVRSALEQADALIAEIDKEAE